MPSILWDQIHTEIIIWNAFFEPISFKVKVPGQSDIGDTATWFECLIAIVTVSIINYCN